MSLFAKLSSFVRHNKEGNSTAPDMEGGEEQKAEMPPDSKDKKEDNKAETSNAEPATEQKKDSTKDETASVAALEKEESSDSASGSQSETGSSDQSSGTDSSGTESGTTSPEASPKKSAEASPKKAVESSRKQDVESSPEASPKKAVESSPKQDVESSPKKDVESSPEKNVESSPKKDAESSPQKAAESSTEKPVDGSPIKVVESSPKKDAESSPQKAVESSTEKSVDASPIKVVESSPKKDAESSPQKAVESSTEKSVDVSPIKVVESSPKNSIESSPQKTMGSSPVKTDPGASRPADDVKLECETSGLLTPSPEKTNMVKPEAASLPPSLPHSPINNVTLSAPASPTKNLKEAAAHKSLPSSPEKQMNSPEKRSLKSLASPEKLSSSTPQAEAHEVVASSPLKQVTTVDEGITAKDIEQVAQTIGDTAVEIKKADAAAELKGVELPHKLDEISIQEEANSTHEVQEQAHLIPASPIVGAVKPKEETPTEEVKHVVSEEPSVKNEAASASCEENKVVTPPNEGEVDAVQILEQRDADDGIDEGVEDNEEFAEEDNSEDYTDEEVVPEDDEVAAPPSAEKEGEEEDKDLDYDEDKRNPQYIPKKGAFYEHDDRRGESDEEEAEVTQEVEVAPPEGEESPQHAARKPRVLMSEQKNRWDHDMFDSMEQSPKSRDELVAQYGYDIRNESTPPRAARRRKYGRGPNKYTRDWQDEKAYHGRAHSAQQFAPKKEDFPCLPSTVKDPRSGAGSGSANGAGNGSGSGNSMNCSGPPPPQSQRSSMPQAPPINGNNRPPGGGTGGMMNRNGGGNGNGNMPRKGVEPHNQSGPSYPITTHPSAWNHRPTISGGSGQPLTSAPARNENGRIDQGGALNRAAPLRRESHGGGGRYENQQDRRYLPPRQDDRQGGRDWGKRDGFEQRRSAPPNGGGYGNGGDPYNAYDRPRPPSGPPSGPPSQPQRNDRNRDDRDRRAPPSAIGRGPPEERRKIGSGRTQEPRPIRKQPDVGSPRTGDPTLDAKIEAERKQQQLHLQQQNSHPNANTANNNPEGGTKRYTAQRAARAPGETPQFTSTAPAAGVAGPPTGNQQQFYDPSGGTVAQAPFFVPHFTGEAPAPTGAPPQGFIQPPSFLGPPPFITPQAAAQFAMMQGVPPAGVAPPENAEVYHGGPAPPGPAGITYYSPQQQMHYVPQPKPPRPKAIIPIVAPPDQQNNNHPQGQPTEA